MSSGKAVLCRYYRNGAEVSDLCPVNNKSPTPIPSPGIGRITAVAKNNSTYRTTCWLALFYISDIFFIIICNVGNLIKRGMVGVGASESSLEEIKKTLHESETKCHVLFEKSIDPVLLMDNGRFIDCNNAALDILHCHNKDRIIGLRPFQISPERQPDGQLSEEKEKTAVYLTGNEMDSRFEWVHRTFDNTDLWVQVSLSTISVNGKLISFVHWRDITERKQAEEKLRTLLAELESKNRQLAKAYEELKSSEAMLIQLEKMASLGQISAGIAHELKNPLSIILQGIAYVQSSVEDGTLVDACERIKKSAIRADIVIQNLLSFSRQAPPSFSEADMNILIEEALAMVEHQMNLQNIEIVRNYSHRIPVVRADGNQIKQVFINIFINATEAMKGGGTITIATTAGSDKDGEPYVRVAITDTGAGIPEEIIKNVLDPFFTTKRGSGGTGLGLSVTKEIIDRHHGSIAINSEEVSGTTVTITLPCNPSKKENTLDG
ncbi:MAG: Sporulation kinase A [Syntrophorhabdus sp. PtaU1.Bin058]|nr:MAG: Sporulation kinase A [Syntrophorhabdus sp. PtaU1.Bin058]